MAKGTASAVAMACGVSAAWLMTGEGQPPGVAAPALPPKTLPAPPLAPMPLTAALDAVYDPQRHKISDALAVRELLAGGLTLSRPSEVEGLALALLDAAARLRLSGAQVTRDALLEALALRVFELEARAAG